MTVEPGWGWADRSLRRARMVILISLATTAWTSLIMPGIGLLREPRFGALVAGGVGVLAFTLAQWGALYSVVTPWLADRTRRRLLAGFAVAAAVSVPLVAPAGGDQWATWAWLGASIVGTAWLLMGLLPAAATATATVVVSLGIGWWTGGSVVDCVLITAGVGIGVAAVNQLQKWFWELLLRAQQGRAAQARLAVAQERLRFARDVHDLLGHSLSVIALKAELAARLAPVDPGRSGAEAAEVQRLAAAALTELRSVVHGYRTVSLREQLGAITEVLRSSGVRCTITQPAEELPEPLATPLVPVLREASTNLLRHSRARQVTIEVTQLGADSARLTVVNDGVTGAAADQHSFGLRGLADRLAETGGQLRTSQEAGVFTLAATVRAGAS